MNEREIATQFLKKINNDDDLVVIECSVSTLEDTHSLDRKRKELTCKFHTKGRKSAKKFILLPTVSHKQTMIVPVLEKILSRVSSDDCHLAPLWYTHNDATNPYTIEEELTYEKFKQVPDIGLGSLQIARYLAAFHAASIVMFRENPAIRKEFQTGVNVEASKVIETVSGGFDAKMMDIFLQNLKKSLGSSDQGVLNHGEPIWSNIFMRYRGCGLWDVRFRNFEKMFINSPVYDVMFFLMSSVAKALRFSQLEHTLQYYHASFMQFCAMLGVSTGYEFHIFREDFRKRSCLGFYFFCCYYGPSTEGFDPEHFSEGLQFFENEGMFEN